MSNEGTLTLLGILIVLSPFLGLPYSWLMVVIPLLGVAVIGFSILVRMRGMRVAKEEVMVREKEQGDETSVAVA